MAPDVDDRPARCPRCGYDLRGEVASWTDRCPMHGRCAECGLEFVWAHVVSSRVRRPMWCVEYAVTPWAVPKRCVKTLGLAFWPWGFWRSLRMYDEPRWGRIGLYLVYLSLPLLLVYTAGNGVAAWRAWDELRSRGWTVPAPVPIIVQTMVAPSSTTSPGTVTVTRGAAPPFTMPYPPPAAVVNGRLLAPVANWVVAFGLVMLALCATGFVALPVSRRQAKVLPRHLVRISLYSLTLLVVPVGVAAVRPYGSMPWLEAVVLVVIPAAVVWWAAATREHLKMRDAWGVAVAIVTMALLATTLCFVAWYVWLTSPL